MGDARKPDGSRDRHAVAGGRLRRIGKSVRVCLLASAAFLGGEVATALTMAFAQVQTSEQSVVLAPGASAEIELHRKPLHGLRLALRCSAQQERRDREARRPGPFTASVRPAADRCTGPSPLVTRRGQGGARCAHLRQSAAMGRSAGTRAHGHGGSALVDKEQIEYCCIAAIFLQVEGAPQHDFLVLGLARRVVNKGIKFGRSKTVELSVKVNYIATCVAFAFIAAILLGAF